MLTGEQDTWLQSRVCGTFNAKVEHINQMPLPIMDRIIRVAGATRRSCGPGAELFWERKHFMFNLDIDEHSFAFASERAKAAFETTIAKAKSGPPRTVLVTHGRQPRPFQKVGAKHSNLGFAIDGRVYWVPKNRFAEFEKAVSDAVLGKDTNFWMGVRRNDSGLRYLMDIDSGQSRE
jgi:hypothetical protein